MKSHYSRWLPVALTSIRQSDIAQSLQPGWLTLAASGCLAAAIAVPGAAAPLTATDAEPAAIAQALPTPLPPLPTNNGVAPASGEQYIVLVSGSSDLLLAQVRQVEPGAFVNYVGGQSLIQAGRFSSYQNAQNRANELASFGIGAEVQAANSTGASVVATPPADYTLSYPDASAAATSAPPPLPSSTVAAAPASIEFGQAAPFATPGVPATAAGLPPTGASSALPNAAAPPLTAPTIVNESLPSGYYVVVPGNTAELQSIVNQVVALGAPSDLVRPRTVPRGPHIAVGPYNDRGIAQEWSDYLRDSGLPGARVHFE
ncbi:MAG: hypothetical protein AAF892_07535 [Cyanobacteria bacterium P01_D01_bin.71]